MKNVIFWNAFLYGMFLLALGKCSVNQIMPNQEKGSTWSIAVGIYVAGKQDSVCSAPYSKAIVKQYAVSETELSGCILCFKAKIWKNTCERGVFVLLMCLLSYPFLAETSFCVGAAMLKSGASFLALSSIWGGLYPLTIQLRLLHGHCKYVILLLFPISKYLIPRF